MSRRNEHRVALNGLTTDDIPEYLTAHSGLPGPRGNLELLDAFGDVGDADLIRRLAADPDEYLRCCGVVGLGRLLVESTGDNADALVLVLRERARDELWRVREAVAIALQRLGDADPARLRTVVADWVRVSEWVQVGDPLVGRAAIAAICEPRLLKDASTSSAALDACAAATAGLLAVPAVDRRRDDVRTLRQALGYCWSVAIAAAPDRGLVELARLQGSTDPDVVWVVRENLRKARLQRVLAAASCPVATRRDVSCRAGCRDVSCRDWWREVS